MRIMKIIGIKASEGIFIGSIYKYNQLTIEIEKNIIEDEPAEIEKFDKAIKNSINDLEKIREQASDTDSQIGEIFDAHIEILNDPELYNSVVDMIKQEKVNVDYAFEKVTNNFIEIFRSMENDYFRERAADIKDISQRVLFNLKGLKLSSLDQINEEVIVLAKDLTPSDTAQLNPKFVKGFITNIGGKTSHSAIMARTLQIPAVVGTKDAFEQLEHGDYVILDGINGEIIKNPTQEQINYFENLNKKQQEQKTLWNAFKDKESVTKDQHKIELSANIGKPSDVENVIENSCEGIGLFRSEFLYMERSSLPSEDEQYEAYSQVLREMDNKPVIIRTLDIGGDKKLEYLDMDKELNPFLGNRALRLCLSKPEIFKSQLRALLRSSVHGNLHIMFPMIATIGELDQALIILEEVKAKLRIEGIPFSEAYKVGMMIEIPSAVFLASEFAKKVDFFSIGTNDLIQYSFAADRMNEKVSYLYQPYNPAFLRMLKMVVDCGHKEGIWIGMCGEMAGDVTSIDILVGLGFDELSMNSNCILQTRYELNKIDYVKAKELANKALKCSYQEEVLELINGFRRRL